MFRMYTPNYEPLRCRHPHLALSLSALRHEPAIHFDLLLLLLLLCCVRYFFIDTIEYIWIVNVASKRQWKHNELIASSPKQHILYVP